LYTEVLAHWFDENVSEDWMKCRTRMMQLLQEEAELEEIVKLVGMDALSSPDRLKLEIARSIREDFLHQNAFHEVDTYTPLEKQLMMMKAILQFYDSAMEALNMGADINGLVSMNVRESIGRFKYVPINECKKQYNIILSEIEREIQAVVTKGGDS